MLHWTKVRYFRQTHHKHLNILLNINATAANISHALFLG